MAKQKFSVEEVLQMLHNIDETESGDDGELDESWSLHASSESDSEDDEQPPVKRSRVVSSNSGTGRLDSFTKYPIF